MDIRVTTAFYPPRGERSRKTARTQLAPTHRPKGRQNVRSAGSNHAMRQQFLDIGNT
jgi:hypothetical protein